MVGTPARVSLVVLYGGRSAEHEVSCVSAAHVLAAADRSRYDLSVVGITRDGAWVDASSALEPTEAVDALASPDDLHAGGAEVLEPVRAARGGAGGAGQGAPLAVLPLLHGPLGEDGCLQGLLELAGVAYCGAGVAGSAAAMDKGLAKSLLAAAGIPQARHIVVHEDLLGPGTADRAEAELGWPVFVKPANMGSSIGVSRVKDPGGLDAALELALRYDELVVLEEAVSGRELEMGVLGWPRLRASAPGEVHPSHDFYDFEDKYVDGDAGLDVPARVPAEVASRMASMAVAACEAMRVDCMARVDFFLEEAGRGLMVNEVNTIPGFTPISMFPRLWAESGIAYPQLVDALVDQALRRASRRARFEVRRV